MEASCACTTTGCPSGSIPATGTMTSTTGMFRIGNMPIPGSTQIFLDGKVDETALWKRGLSQAEIMCIMNYGALPTDADLKLYYKMDQGTAGGTNTGLSTLTDASGHSTPLNGTNVGFALNGTASNYVDGSPIAGYSTAYHLSWRELHLQRTDLDPVGHVHHGLPAEQRM